MKNNLPLLLAATTLSAFCLTGWSQDLYNSKTGKPVYFNHRDFDTQDTDKMTWAAKPAPDNTALNVRDRDGSTLTPIDQGNSGSDRNTTAMIRKGILARKEMSMNAMNVKIMTVNGQVTLRGPVDTEKEKREIGMIADRVANTQSVDNQLEVRLNSTKVN